MARKLYVIKAEQMMVELFKAYYEEHGKLPDNMSTFKGSITRAFNAVDYSINSKILPKLVDQKTYFDMKDHKDYQLVVKDVMTSL